MYKAKVLINSLRGTINTFYGRFYAKSPKEGGGKSNDDKEFIRRYVDVFQNPDIDGWEIRRNMNNLAGMDLVPDPLIIDAALRACRRVNDIGIAIRWIEVCKHKCGAKEKVIYPYIMENIRPTLIELGIPTLEELGFDKPQLGLVSVFDM